ncbi:MAG: thioredoxin domain-containing protein [Deltaproteobacteria bacterium]|nr:thioredoxin domain-containing protein [Deltaproteobacteria bacterium]
MLEKYPKEVKLVHKFLPHNGEFSRKAAIAAMAADEQGKFWEFHDMLLDNQGGLDDAKILEMAATLKLDVDRFKKKMLDPATEAVIKKDLDDVARLGIHWTPEVYINGMVFNRRALPDFVSAVEGELSK